MRKRNRTSIILAGLLALCVMGFVGSARAQALQDDCNNPTYANNFERTVSKTVAETNQKRSAAIHKFFLNDPTLDAKASQCFDTIVRVFTSLRDLNASSFFAITVGAAISEILQNLLAGVCQSLDSIVGNASRTISGWRSGGDLFCLPMPDINFNLALNLPELSTSCSGVPIATVGAGTGIPPQTPPDWRAWGR